MKNKNKKEKKETRWEKFKNSKFFLGMICLIIGITYTFAVIEGQDYNDWLQEGLSYTYKEVVVKDVGVSVEIHPETEARDTLSEEREVSLPSPNIEDKIRKIAKRENFEDADLLVRIASCESGLIPDRKSDVKTSSATGLFQILDMHKLSVEERCNVDISTTWAINKIKSGGLNAWNESRHCWNI